MVRREGRAKRTGWKRALGVARGAEKKSISQARKKSVGDPTWVSEFHAERKRKAGDDCASIAPTSHSISEKENSHAIVTLERYQTVSDLSASAATFDNAAWVASSLREIHLPSPHRLRLLDVGALRDYYSSRYSDFLEVCAIDLHPRDERVLKEDFFRLPTPRCEADRFDAVVLSLVLNYVDTPRRRGEMLRRAAHFARLGSGRVYLVLPTNAVHNSRYMRHKRLIQLCRSLGLLVVHQERDTKLCRYIFRRVETEQPDSLNQTFPKRVCRFGRGQFNNFSITLENT
uniref:Uncharacterized protein n=1 Tax=Compsopogon caeruleus TaxID=31354 RepID=A0A7S1TGM8_9RHOD|mmetsp:Transcript_6672/g.13566  ORF Transcript_6672/g.13566 Transcript_6672/m.13566 type:complete len:287 (+) Transcript_6672:195-1055(+)|eukprot:CAMPEP_0184684216 /NCGR_PEP_ID=MMETSP0312-20130426/14319_1 /TAXON_ID=31354 /ORGANISM="Compsopogon coeruleus, Strain SAG 36.94" /LENGTH=286 /DNA_ID=CAMNT_0027137181 /DNA_START=145 /DNA_END=1005 /DNA_ORIENTATION=+